MLAATQGQPEVSEPTTYSVDELDTGSEEYYSANSDFGISPPTPPKLFDQKKSEHLLVLALEQQGKLDDARQATEDDVRLDQEVAQEEPASGEEWTPPHLRFDDVYVKVATQNKKTRNLSFVVKSQEFAAHEGTVSVLRFNMDGTRLATAGSHLSINIWNVTPPQELEQQVAQIAASLRRRGQADGEPRLKYGELYLIDQNPLRKLMGHSADIKDLSWSPNNFILSSSNDCTVRLWHPDLNPPCLRVVSHPHFVNCVAFNPHDEAVFLSGCADQILRVFSIQPTTTLEQEMACRGIPTSITFDHDGKSAIIGTVSGLIKFFNVERLNGKWRLRLRTEQEIRERRTKGRGRVKINNIEVISTSYIASCDDSVVRLYSMYDNTLRGVYKGHKNLVNLGASLSADGKFLLVGSEPSSVFLYEVVDESRRKRGGFSEKHRVLTHRAEFFKATESRLSCATFYPARVKPWTKSPAGGASNPAWRDTAPVSSPQLTEYSVSRSRVMPTGVDNMNLADLSSPSPLPSPSQFGAQGKSPQAGPKDSSQTLYPSAGLFIVVGAWDGTLSVFYNVGIDTASLNFLS
uniref:Anaphase-promoting complex subunit 4 WD40 domain-containing protein n=1 Tax=Rhodosorus marinus TaxID=101924 RepID=A0A7S3ELB9_9RHOD|mmetsp:Transcript_45341/g.176136  ORF Transcript_45341/g.176136 Transcript_45341/m.176136 type:complete len:576 (+) Transcript_45341:413-2140(+)|eukprot:CAMPEP_0113966888 /NCGR_PEP_ID=MMETSP0011_2-20120614/8563_1 /TAXON_ID=101924 /ORGANISM="Rhodosorus marinus" /LENGTH=575 /DNA_ID=CAMNT_0000979587 /DNA_START=304 /DNA_END=2034 /DNA_ORIENTATION=+ /assembly_acc=CAM_ASM_000156